MSAASRKCLVLSRVWYSTCMNRKASLTDKCSSSTLILSHVIRTPISAINCCCYKGPLNGLFFHGVTRQCTARSLTVPCDLQQQIFGKICVILPPPPPLASSQTQLRAELCPLSLWASPILQASAFFFFLIPGPISLNLNQLAPELCPSSGQHCSLLFIRDYNC